MYKNLPDDGPMDPKPAEVCIGVINLLLTNFLCIDGAALVV
jgi:hypothetical protein